MAGSQRIDCIDELKELQINGCEQKNEDGVFLLENVPDPVLKILLNYLTLKDKKNLRLVSLCLSDRVLRTDPRLRSWIIRFNKTRKTMDPFRDNQQSQEDKLTPGEILDIIQALHNVQIKLSVEFMKIEMAFIFGSSEVVHNNMTRDEKQKLLIEWKNQLKGLDMSIQDNEQYLISTLFPKLDKLVLHCPSIIYYPEESMKVTELYRADILSSLIHNHTSTLNDLELEARFPITLKTTRLNLKRLKFTDYNKETFFSILNVSSDSLVSLHLPMQVHDESLPDNLSFPNLRHLCIEIVTNLALALMQRCSAQLVTLKVNDIMFVQLNSENPDQFQNLQVLWIDEGDDFPSTCVQLRCLVVRHIYRWMDGAMEIPTLRDLAVGSVKSFSRKMMRKNAAHLEFLLISQTNNLKQEFFNFKFERLKVFLLPNLKDKRLLNVIRSVCPADTKIITDSHRGRELFVSCLKRNHLYPDIATDEDLYSLI